MKFDDGGLVDPVAIVLVVISALAHALRDFFTKKSVNKQVFAMLFQWVGFVYFFPLFVYYLWKDGLPITSSPLGVLAGSIAVHFFYWVFLTKSLEHGDLSRVYPIIRSSPAFVLAASVLLFDDQVSLAGVSGILIVVFGVFLINAKEGNLREFKGTFSSIVKEKPAQFAVLTLLCVVSCSIIDKVAVQEINPMVFIYIMALAVQIMYAPYVLRQHGWEAAKKEWRQNRPTILINGFLVTFGYWLILIAFTFEKVSYVVGLRQLSVVFAVILGGKLLNEENKQTRLLASCIIFTGSLLIALA